MYDPSSYITGRQLCLRTACHITTLSTPMLTNSWAHSYIRLSVNNQIITTNSKSTNTKDAVGQLTLQLPTICEENKSPSVISVEGNLTIQTFLKSYQNISADAINRSRQKTCESPTIHTKSRLHVILFVSHKPRREGEGRSQ